MTFGSWKKQGMNSLLEPPEETHTSSTPILELKDQFWTLDFLSYKTIDVSFQATKFTVLCYKSDSKLIRHLLCKGYCAKPFHLLFYLALQRVLWVAFDHFKDAKTEA